MVLLTVLVLGFLSCIGIGIGIVKRNSQVLVLVLVLLRGFSKYWYWYWYWDSGIGQLWYPELVFNLLQSTFPNLMDVDRPAMS